MQLVGVHRSLTAKTRKRDNQGRRSVRWIRGTAGVGRLCHAPPISCWVWVWWAQRSWCHRKPGLHSFRRSYLSRGEQGLQLGWVCAGKVEFPVLIACTPIPECTTQSYSQILHTHVYIHSVTYGFFFKVFSTPFTSRDRHCFGWNVNKTAAWGRYTWQKEVQLEIDSYNGKYCAGLLMGYATNSAWSQELLISALISELHGTGGTTPDGEWSGSGCPERLSGTWSLGDGFG